jgi:5-methylcytosine-specific restriction endonuclease McrA
MKRKNKSDLSQETLFSGPDEKAIKREKEKARKLRQTAWWQSKLDKGECHYCGNKFPREEFTMDHVVPLSRGGTSTKGNIVVCCKECNNQKKSLTPVEMLLSKKFNSKTNVDAEL